MKELLVCLWFLLSVICPVLGSKIQLGAPSAFINQLERENTRNSRVYTLPTLPGQEVKLHVEDFYYQEESFSMAGKVLGTPNSDFILKGNTTDTYGWVVLRDQNLAYEYTTTADGQVLVEQVSVEKIYPVCHFPDVAPFEATGPYSSFQEEITEEHIGPYDGSNINELESLPGAEKVLYMDITRIMDGDEPTRWTKEEMWKIWQGFAAGVSMFNVNVTTNRDVYDAAGISNSGRSNLYSQSGTSNCGINSFGTTRSCTIYKKSSPLYNAGTLIHEVGHQLGLSHDGTSSETYYRGRSEFEWLPIMGSHLTGLEWNELLWQWSKGEYSGANRNQDDLDLMNRHLDYRQDDNTETVSVIYKTGTTEVLAEDNWGQIARNSDRDAFSFQIGNEGGRVQLRIDRIEFTGGSMLDVEARLNDASGNLIASSNPKSARFAEIIEVLEPGIYELYIMGGAEGTPSNGFSNYSSLGFYGIEGEIVGGVNNQINNSINASGPTNFCDGQSVTLSAFIDSAYTYQWYKGGIPIAGATGSFFRIYEEGNYYVQVSDGENQVLSPTIDIDLLQVPESPSTSHVCLSNDSAHLSAYGTGGPLNWYSSQVSQEVLNIGNEFNVDVPAPITYYVSESNQKAPVFVGPENNSFGGGGFHAGDYYLVFDTKSDLIIKSIKVFAQGSKTRRFVLYHSDGSLMDSKDIQVADGEIRIELNFNVPLGMDYKLGIDKINDGDVDMYRNNIGPAYPYDINGLVSIKGSSASTEGYYYYAYHWEVQENKTVCESPRVPVFVESCTDIPLRTTKKILITHGPGNLIQIRIPGNYQVHLIALYSVDGIPVFLSKNNVDVLDLSNFPAGIYRLKVITDQRTLIKTIVQGL